MSFKNQLYFFFWEKVVKWLIWWYGWATKNKNIQSSLQEYFYNKSTSLTQCLLHDRVVKWRITWLLFTIKVKVEICRPVQLLEYWTISTNTKMSLLCLFLRIRLGEAGRGRWGQGNAVQQLYSCFPSQNPPFPGASPNQCQSPDSLHYFRKLTDIIC